jgi:polyisoprenoid-binding protein YceI
MKKIALILFLLISFSTFAQKYFTKTGNTQFKASVEAFEPVEATNNSTTAIINVTSGEIASLLFVKAFNFRVALMQEHFNENYMDSSTFPKATFKGLISDFNLSDISSAKKKYLLKGTLTVRGVEKEIETLATFSKKEDKLLMVTSFGVKPEDFNIKIPKIVSSKIAGTINISLAYEFIEKK